jgi:hypothetical protein
MGGTTDPHQNAMEEVARLSPVFDVLRRRRPDLTADFGRRYPELKDALEGRRILGPGNGEPGGLEGLRPGGAARRARGAKDSQAGKRKPGGTGTASDLAKTPSSSRKPTSTKFCRS